MDSVKEIAGYASHNFNNYYKNFQNVIDIIETLRKENSCMISIDDTDKMV